jgi:ATP-binding protein involved in chromosome partitioning
VQILGLIENMSFFKCPKCGEKTDVFGHGGAKLTAKEMNMEFLAEVLLISVSISFASSLHVSACSC